MISDIPKIIHYCWFGSEMPLNVQKNINSWREKCPDYQFILWNEKNFDINQFEYTQQAASVGKWAFVSDVARLVAVEKMGGYYLDTDVFLNKSLDNLSKLNGDWDCFFAMEFPGRINTGIGFGATKNNLTLQRLIDVYKNTDYTNVLGNPIHRTTVDIVSDEFHRFGLKNRNRLQQIIVENEKILVLPFTYFYSPLFGHLSERKKRDCIAIHRNDSSWYDKSSNKEKFKTILIPLSMYGRLTLDFCFGYGTYNKLKKVIHKE